MVSIQHRQHHEDLWQGAASDARGYISGYVRYQCNLRGSRDTITVIGALDAPDYASFVSHSHPDGQVSPRQLTACTRANRTPFA